MKAELTSGTRGKFYRKSTAGSRIKKAAKKIGKTASRVLTAGTSVPLEKLSPTIDSKIKKFKKASALRMKTSPALAKLSASCKAAAKRKFKVYPSAYANMWASKTQKAGKC